MRRSDGAAQRSWRRGIVLLALTVLAWPMSRAASADPFGYVPNHGSGTVSVIDTANNAVMATVTVGSQPLGAAVNPAGTRAYITNQTAVSGSVSVIDTSVNGVVATVVTGARPSGVAVKLPGDFVYVTNRDDKAVQVIKTATDTVVKTIDVDNNPLGIAVDPAGNPAYVVNKGSNDVSVIDTTTNEVSATIAVGNDPSHVAISPNGLRVYVTNNSNASVSVIDTGVNSVIATIPVGALPEGVAVDPGGTRAYVANSGPNSVSVIDTASNGVVATVDVGLAPFELALRPDGARLFVTNRQGGSISVIDTATNAVASTVDVGLNPSGFGQFVTPALSIPRLGSVARKCQVAVARQGVRLARLHHALVSKCQLGLIRAEAVGKGTAAADAACQKDLDAGNPASTLARGRTKARAVIERRCSKVQPRQINAPCSRGAATFGATADCLSTQHAIHVGEMAAGEFSSIRPVPLTDDARKCQTAIARNARRFAERLHKDLGACLERLLVAADAGKGDAKAVAACLAKLDLANAASKASTARDTALVAMARKCADTVPADLGSPCQADAATTAATAACVVDADAGEVAKLTAAEFNDACVILTRIGLGGVYPRVCSGSR